MVRIFIHGVDSFLGKALVRELRKAEGGSNRMFGTCNNGVDKAPSVVKRPLPSISSMAGQFDPQKLKKLVDTVQSCRLVIMDLFNSTLEDLHFAIQALKVDPKADPPKVIGEGLENDVTFILISSAMVWAGCEKGSSGYLLRDSDYRRRKPLPGSRYEAWKEMEDLVMTCFNREESKIKGFIVSPGLLYGEGEETFAQLFKGAWLGEQSHRVTKPGNNFVPTVHVRDLARVVRQLGFNGGEINAMEKPYYLAVDQPEVAPGDLPKLRPLTPKTDAPDEGADALEEAEEEAKAAAPPADEAEGGEGEEGEAAKPKAKTRPSTQKELIQGIVDDISVHYDVPVVDEASLEALPEGEDEEARSARDLREAMAVDLWLQPSRIMLEEGFAGDVEPAGMLYKKGLLANLQTVAEEFCKERKLRPIRVLIAGPPASGKTTLAKSVAEHFNIPHLELADDLGAMATQLQAKVCRYRGFVLDVGSAGFEEVDTLLRIEREVQPAEGEEEEPPPAEEEGEEGGPPAPRTERVVNTEVCPEFVIVTQAPEAFCRGRWRAQHKPSTEEDMAPFRTAMDGYREKNLSDYQSLTDFFQDCAHVGVLNLPVPGKDAEDLLESVRIYVEGSEQGRPFNYLRTGEEVAEELLEKQAERATTQKKEAEEEAARRAEDKSAELEEAQSQKRRLQLIAAHEQEQKSLEAQPLREYLMRYMVPSLTEGLIEVCKVLPEDPVDYLATYLEDHVDGLGAQQASTESYTEMSM
eukprot:TRINITY_DN9667_c0_g1_i1.p1 TRINITY_DN9667_c0_g1~~TRINITY_DN9667_c0_g1_i1.p1  ORF type:complete len:750 (+),score=273.97 TRINITY_DN9667_c0_g1_i1:181-2430(+)